MDAVVYFFLSVGLSVFHLSKATEPMCSKFAYDEQLLEKMIRTEVKVEAMVNEMKTTQDNVLHTLRAIEETVANFSGRFADLKEDIMKEMLKEGDNIKQREDLFQKLFEETKANLTNAVDDQRKTIVELQGQLGRPSVAFHAHHVTDKNLDTKDEVIIFDKTFVNEGKGYSTSTGIFTAPIGGLYQFAVHICTYVNKYTSIGLVLEGTVIAGNLNYDKVYYTCSTVGAIVKVRSGEKVWVKPTAAGPSYQMYEDSLRINTFSGLLISN